MTDRSYVPALSFDALTRFYDPLIALTLRERTLKTRLLEQARIAPGHAVLDVGCGTGTLALMAKQRAPSARVAALDGDPAVLAIARRKLERAGVEVELREGLADSTGAFAASSFDRVLSSRKDASKGLPEIPSTTGDQRVIIEKETPKPGDA